MICGVFFIPTSKLVVNKERSDGITNYTRVIDDILYHYTEVCKIKTSR